MAEYPSEFEFDVLLRDGRAIRLRPIKPEDAPREHDFFQRVGPESVYRRFFQVKTDLHPRRAASLHQRRLRRSDGVRARSG